MHTEEEAKETWCPHVRVVMARRKGKATNADIEPFPPTLNRIHIYGEPDSMVRPTCCIGSKCMAWRWFGGTERSGQGYCGLAGRP